MAQPTSEHQPDPEVASRTRRSLHGAAELLLAGPQFREAGTVRLRVDGTELATTVGADRRLSGTALVVGGSRLPLPGRTYAEVAAEAGFEVRDLEDVYSDGPHARPGDRIVLDADETAHLLRCFGTGARALAGFAPQLTAVLWPEHFDVAVEWDEVTYGISPGDRHVAEPYAYVGPHRPREGAFWNESFGACRTLRELGDAAAVAAFLAEGRRLAAASA